MTKQKQQYYAALDAVSIACITRDQERLDVAVAHLERLEAFQQAARLEERRLAQEAMIEDGYKTPLAEALDQGLRGGL